MTGRELIIYILQNDLLDNAIYDKNGINLKNLGLISVSEVAAKSSLGEETVKVWAGLGYLDGFKFDGSFVIIKNHKLDEFLRLRGQTKED